MNNPRITKKERGLLKGAIRRVFSRSDLRRAILQSVKITHTDVNRPRVKTWYYCEYCGGLYPQCDLQVDHKDPIVPLETTLEAMSWDTVIDRIWCQSHNLWVLCLTCHKAKSKVENACRRQSKKETKNG